LVLAFSSSQVVQCAGGRADRSPCLQCVQSLWKTKQIHITENGCAAEDLVAEDGAIYDTDRTMFLRNNLPHSNGSLPTACRSKATFNRA
jgi:hypothetical protein